MNESLTSEEYLQTKPDSVKELIVTSLRILNTFTKLTYAKTLEDIIFEYSVLDRDKRSYFFLKDSLMVSARSSRDYALIFGL